MAYDANSPIGESRLDVLLAYLMAFLANMHRREDQEAVKASDFLLDFWAREPGDPEPPQSLEEQRQIIQAMKLVFERPHPQPLS